MLFKENFRPSLVETGVFILSVMSLAIFCGFLMMVGE
jgi:hypothetical protein